MRKGQKIRVAADLRMYGAGGVTFTRLSTFLPSWDHIDRKAEILRRLERRGLLASAKADNADAQNQFPALTKCELAAAAVLSSPEDRQ